MVWCCHSRLLATTLSSRGCCQKAEEVFTMSGPLQKRKMFTRISAGRSISSVQGFITTTSGNYGIYERFSPTLSDF